MAFLQSKEWMEFQRSLGREVLEYDKEGISAKAIKYDLPFGKNYLYIPHGPAMDFNQMTGGLKNPVANFVKWLREEGKKRKSIFIKVEPLIDSVAQVLASGGKFSAGGGPASGWRKSKKEIQPSKTVIIDLEQSENELLGRMHHKTRYNIGVADKHGVVVGESNDSEVFLKLIKKTAKRDRFSPHAGDYYKKLLSNNGLQTKLYLAKYDNKPIAAAIILIYGDTGYYLHGASDYDHRAIMAPQALHWHIIKQLKAKNLKHYDMWGIDSRKWPGVTRFKLGWGGRTVELPGAFDLPVSRFWYLAYRIVRKF
ncbi:MAG: hypothetical protein A2831_01145 [Candidatus Yanofskybacteria bacterium RIFCSPHIGHO2_01_FULL_44_17]|uniref:BioF2-like acetyltransferase domain-containing protein n=1 Tax=Candidatus Yanofskybacteria bacterium RIFCSPHIGHO2_01_FULL_44_17 TaxID=1802668 RepID=A0A1F8ETU9_9BACT|nr:MAG: hypothetical protein A2831_01145 [Candidatus Yanofskybacteria bacterium RIFCSPHIGHO2_01_FULL_44_17]